MADSGIGPRTEGIGEEAGSIFDSAISTRDRESPMSSYVFVEGAGQLCFCAAEIDMETGKWLPTVSFERRSDYGKAKVQTIKHRLKELFDTETGAVQAAEYYAGQNKDRAEIGL
jgi:hypothetical protein